ncbi:MAG TPA: tRNA uridine-5-carboxymethylaminomethyl(34) synthesis GTPase MnmE, partial [Syntrophales bacterium]|nr:tRNA uridine-5-carboxymethylaminomethyl(34) synthesis GTPase MnmE [Syntrophales bacterium]
MARDVETIAAVATPRGKGSVGIIRISGRDAEAILRRLFQPHGETHRPLESHRLYFGRITVPESDRVLDEVLVTVMRAPRSFTGEDVAEIHCHGSPLLLERILDEVLRQGARPAEPGEFTRRAFLNDRINLAQAEAVLDLVEGKTEKGADIALAHLQG